MNAPTPESGYIPDDTEGIFDPTADPVVWGTHDKPEVVKWLWKGKIVRGGLQLLAGEPARGKSTILCDLAARITSGADWPDGQAGDAPARVVLMTKEDDYHSVWLPRFLAAGGDKALLGHIPMWKPFELDTKIGLKWMKHHMKANDPRVALFIVDPLDDFTGAGVDSHKAKSVRNALMHVHVLATRYQSAIVAIKHLNKVGEAVAGKTPLQRLEGSAAYGAIPRNVLVVAGSADHRLFFGVLKGSLVPPAQQTAVEYTTESVPHPIDPDPESAVSHIVWKEECAVSMNTLMGNPSTEMKPVRPAPEQEKAETFLKAELGDGQPHAIGLVRDRARLAGIKMTTLDRARLALEVKSDKGCYSLVGAGGGTAPGPAFLAAS
jgi:putative DNA primase/helicase